MEWLPKWLGSVYIELYTKFGEEIFTVEEARQAGLVRNTRVVLSNLVKAGWALRSDRGAYMVLHPTLVAATYEDGNWLDEIRQPVYLPIIARLASSAVRRFERDLVSFAIYGSVAAGHAGKRSDIDILLVVKGLPASYSQRAVLIADIVRETSQLRIGLWREKGIYPDVEVIALTKEEASVTQPIYLEMLEECVFVIDQDGFLTRRLEQLTKRMGELGSRKIETPGGEKYWVLSPSSIPGEGIRI